MADGSSNSGAPIGAVGASTVPAGLGGWVAYPSMIGGYAEIYGLLTELGFGWMAPRAGFNGWNDPGWKSDSISGCSVPVYPWIYVTPGANPDQLARDCARLVSAGATGVILDPETEWTHYDLGVSEAKSRRLIQAVRAAIPGTFLAYAPMDYIDNHPKFPWTPWHSLCDACMPQVYAWEHDDRGHMYHLAKTTAQWDAWEAQHRVTTPRWPIACTYRPAKRGGKQLSALPDQPKTISADLVYFLSQFDCNEPVSLYSLEMMDGVLIDALRQRAGV